MKTFLYATVPHEGSGMGSGNQKPEQVIQEAIRQSAANPTAGPKMNPNPHYGDGSTYGSVRYAVGDVELPTPQGEKVKLDLSARNDANLLQFAGTHITKMTGNPNFVTPYPSAPDFLTVFTAFQNALDACEAAKDAQKQATLSKDEARTNLVLFLNQRGDYVQSTSNGNGPVIVSAGFDLRNPRVPVGELPPPTNLSLELNGTAGVMALKWSGVPSARAYAIQISPADTMERNWTPYETTTATRYQCVDMTLGQKYAFRLAAIGGSTGQSLWSVEVVRMAA